MIAVRMSSPRVLLARGFCVCAAACTTDTAPTSTGGNTLAPSVNTAVTQLIVVDVALGTGAVANSGSRITVSSSGFLFDANAFENKGRPFDANTAYTFTLGAGTGIKGWGQGRMALR